MVPEDGERPFPPWFPWFLAGIAVVSLVLSQM
jgi:hypothetical protein